MADFLELSEAENAMVELKLAIGQALRERRAQRNLSQTALARQIRSSQSRVAKMEAGDLHVSFDLLLRALFTLGATRDTLAEIIGSHPSGGPQQEERPGQAE